MKRPSRSIGSGNTTVDERSPEMPQASGKGSSKGPNKGDAVMVAVRPEKIETGAKAASAVNRLSGTLVAKSYLGDRNHLFVRVDGIDKPIALSMQNVGATAAESTPGLAPILIFWPAESDILLPAA